MSGFNILFVFCGAVMLSVRRSLASSPSSKVSINNHGEKGGITMIRIGRLVIDEGSVAKVVRDAKAGTTTLYALGSNGLVELASFKKHAASAWETFKEYAD